MFKLFTLTLLSFFVGLIPPFDVLLHGQQSVEAQNYIVASGHPESTKIGQQILREGGNVVDAAIATSFALGVAEPYGSGLGGKLIMLYREASTGKIFSIVALCQAPSDLNVEKFIDLPTTQKKYGYQSVGVPGLVAGLDEAHRRWGSVDWSQLVNPAAKLAEKGVKIDKVMQGMFRAKESSLRQDEEASLLYLVDGKAPEIGTVMKNADLAESLNEIATQGPRAFYEGAIARRIVSAARNNGSALTMEDFRNYRAEIRLPIKTNYKDYVIYSCPPPLSGGVTVLAALECLERMEFDSKDQQQVEFADAMGRALHCIYPRIQAGVADIPGATKAARILTSSTVSSELAQLAQELEPGNSEGAFQKQTFFEPMMDDHPLASTSHLLVVDKFGNMVSLTQSLSLHFGASVVAPNTGILLNDSMSNFATITRKSPNFVQPSKRARSTIAPIIATKNDQPWLAMGIPGGQRIPTTTIQLLWRLIDTDASLAEAFDAPRFHLRRPLSSSAPRNQIDYEEGASRTWLSLMKDRGWSLNRKKRNGHYFGGGSGAQYSEHGTIIGVADPRRTNFVAGD